MIRHLTDSDLKKQLSELTMLIDTREQQNSHITGWLEGKKIPLRNRALDIGDYSAMLGEYSCEDEIAVERKADLDELAGNLTTSRDRFEREFTRAKANGTKVFLLIEDASWNDVLLHNYRSQLKPESLMASLLSWQVRYNITVIFCKPAETGQIIYRLLYYWMREQIKQGWRP